MVAEAALGNPVSCMLHLGEVTLHKDKVANDNFIVQLQRGLVSTTSCKPVDEGGNTGRRET